jgi:hypothetical protein
MRRSPTDLILRIRNSALPHLPKLTKGQRLDAPDLLEPPLPRPLTHGHAKVITRVSRSSFAAFSLGAAIGFSPPRGSSSAGAGPSWAGGTRGMPSGEIWGGNGPAAGALIRLTTTYYIQGAAAASREQKAEPEGQGQRQRANNNGLQVNGQWGSLFTIPAARPGATTGGYESV